MSELDAQRQGGLPFVLGRDWDTRVVWLEAKQRWWWNAWRARTATELHGFADSRDDATHAMHRAIAAAPPVVGEVPRARRERWPSPGGR